MSVRTPRSGQRSKFDDYCDDIDGSDIDFVDFKAIELGDFFELRAKYLASDVVLEVSFVSDFRNGHILEA